MATTGGGPRMGLGGALAVAVGTTIGGGLFAFVGPAAKDAGAWLPWAFLVGVIPPALALAPFAMLASALPTQGGNYRYPSRLVSPSLAFVALVTFAFGAVFGMFPLYALTAADYVQAVLPNAPIVAVAIGLLAVGWGVNVLGVRLAMQVEGALVLVLIVALGTYLAGGLGQLAPSSPPPAGGAGGLLAAGALLSFAYQGSNALIELGADIERPSRNVPLAMLGCLVLVTGLYVAIGFVTVRAVEPAVAAEAGLLGVASRILAGPAHTFFVLGGGLMALVTSLNAAFLWGTKSLQALCEDGFLPAAWGADHPRFGTPHRLLTGIFALSALGILAPVPRDVFNVFATLGGLLLLVPVHVAAMRLPRERPDAYAAAGFKLTGPWLWIAPGIGILTAVVGIAALLAEVRTMWPLAVWLAWVLAAIAYARLRSGKIQVNPL